MTAAPQPRERVPAVLIITDLVVICRHLELLAEAERQGLATLLVMGQETPADSLAAHRADPAHPLSRAEHVLHVPEHDLDTLVDAVWGPLRHYDVRAVLNCGEVFVEAAGTLAQTLGLPGPGAHAARVCRNKVLQRLAVPSLAPRWSLPRQSEGWVAPDVGGGSYLAVPFPAVLKPAARMSSSGVRAVNGPEELAAELPTYPDDETLLLEERVSGREFSVEALVHEGEVIWAGVTAKTTNEADSRYFTETGHTSPAPGLSETEEARLREANTEVVTAIGFGTGMTHAEFRLDDQRVVLMEIAARPPGDAIMKLWHLATGRSLEPALLELALGRRPLVSAARRQARQLYLDHPVGQLRSVECAEGTPVTWIADAGAWPSFEAADEDAPARLCAVVVTRQAGAELGDLADSGGRAVSIVVDGPTGEDLQAAAERWAKTIRIRTTTAGLAGESSESRNQ